MCFKDRIANKIIRKKGTKTLQNSRLNKEKKVKTVWAYQQDEGRNTTEDSNAIGMVEGDGPREDHQEDDQMT